MRKQDLNLPILKYNNTPKYNLKSSSQVLMGRLLNTQMTINNKTFKPPYPIKERLFKQVLEKSQERPNKCYARSAHPLQDSGRK